MMKFEATVVRGEGKGRQLGFPTINLDVSLLNLDLDFGVYASKVFIGDDVYKGALHYGARSTFDQPEPTLEIYLLDFDGDLYGAKVSVEILKKIRDTKKFTSKEELIEQIRQDVEAVNKL